jgi:hypothetical protein
MTATPMKISTKIAVPSAFGLQRLAFPIPRPSLLITDYRLPITDH